MATKKVRELPAHCELDDLASSGLVAGMSAAFLTATVISLAAVVLSAMMRKTEGAGPGHAAH